jgi:serine carboxypeptidase-like clade 1
VGNGATDPQYDGDAFPPFAVGKSLVPTSLYFRAEAACKGNYWDGGEGGGRDCVAALASMHAAVKDLNLYDVLEE